MRKNYYSLLIFLAIVFLARASLSLAQSFDAIAIRVIPNPKHQSINTWFKAQGFEGSPQSITVDGYEAVRDGRTVYVNVGNVTPEGLLFTNVYLISYNQDAEISTTDIFGNILANWKFNSNLPNYGRCRYQGARGCLIDDDCPIGDYCRSTKARVIRDVKRLSDAITVRTYLSEYKNQNGNFPVLDSGSYLANRSFSAWPSWQATLGRELGRQLPFDPVNRFGDCTGFNEQTCWSEEQKRFASVPPNFPDGSLVYYYYSDSVGLSADICIVSESGFAINPPPDCLIDVCLDFDGDGYGYPASASCDEEEPDCDDYNPLSSVPEAEICDNNYDDNCNGIVDCYDVACVGNEDCSTVSFCGDEVCDVTETCPVCPECCSGPICGDGVCELSECASCYNFAGLSATADCYCGDLVTCSVQGEECDGGASCDGSCQAVALSCEDNDGDLYIDGLTDIALCNALETPPCGFSSNMICLGNNDCDDDDFTRNPGADEQCDNIDHNCRDGVSDGFSEELCDWACVTSGYNWTGNGGNLNCCGNQAGEGSSLLGTFQVSEDLPIDYCSDAIDNDCDGTFDSNIANLINPDTDCLPCESSENINESFWYVVDQGDCNQCDNPGDDDGNQEDVAGPYWATLYPAEPELPDRCDPACSGFFADPRVSPLSQPVHINDYEAGGETVCNDDLDNDCDGLMNCDDPDCALECVFSCVGSVPLNSEFCVGSDLGLTADTSNTLVAACTAGGFCEYECQAGYTFVAGVCMRDCYRDFDADGFGDLNTVAQFEICPGLGNYVEDNTDCDDTRIFVYPGNPNETCDGYDNDCSDPIHTDGVNPADIDEGCDDDGDGYCDDSIPWFATTLACPSTLGAGTYDCDDDPLTCGASCNPGFLNEVAETNCFDGYDNDCDGLVDCTDIVDCSTDSNCIGAEICNDTIDNDGDGCIDLIDSDCGGVEDCDVTAPGDDDCDGSDNTTDPDCLTNTCTLSFELPCILL